MSTRDLMSELEAMQFPGVLKPLDENALLRWADFGEGVELILWDSYKRDGGAFGRCYLGYCLTVGGSPIFWGDTYSPGMGTAIDSDDSVWGCLYWLTLDPRENEDACSEYSDEQHAWASGEQSERLRLMVYDYENRAEGVREHGNDFRVPTFQDLDW